MRRLAVLALSALALTACSGEQGQRAQALLTRAQTAQAGLKSATYDARMTFSMDGQQYAIVMNGGGYMKGRRAGDQLMNMRADGIPGAGNFNMAMVVRGGQISMTMNGRTLTLNGTALKQARKQDDWSTTMLDLARYVKRVKVYDGRVVNGEAGSTIAGVIDTQEMLRAMSKLEALGQAANMNGFSGKLGDIHAALFVSKRTGLIRSAVISMSMEAQGKKADVELTYRLDSTNTKVPGL
jgi:outer membrane lipoprotein-sorting protein